MKDFSCSTIDTTPPPHPQHHFYINDPGTNDIMLLNPLSKALTVEKPTTDDRFWIEQTPVTSCKMATIQVGCEGFAFFIKHHRLGIRKSLVEDETPVAAQESLENCILYLSHYPQIAGSSVQCKMYYTPWRILDWSHIARNVCTKVADCAICVQNEIR